jgi:hypothetical protein
MRERSRNAFFGDNLNHSNSFSLPNRGELDWIIGSCSKPFYGFGFVGEFQRARAAFRALRERSSGESFAAFAGPPFKPPSLPKATAAGFFSFLTLEFLGMAVKIYSLETKDELISTRLL